MEDSTGSDFNCAPHSLQSLEKVLLASLLSHAVAALSIGSCFYRPGRAKRLLATGALCSVIPDLDVIGFRFGIRYGDFWGHRGFTHSLVFAALLAGGIAALGFRKDATGLSRYSLWAYFFLATASHGLLDAMTIGFHTPEQIDDVLRLMHKYPATAVA